jgi:preprotein translocase subunit Sec61beta
MDAFIEAIGLSIVGGLIAGLIVWFVTERMENISVRSRVAIVLAIAIILILILATFQIGNLKEVPNLAGLSKDSADQQLMNLHLVPNSRYDNSLDTQKDHVIANSQDPIAGTLVREGTQVSYAVSKGSLPPPPPPPNTTSAVSFISPTSNGKVTLRADATGIYTFSVTGTSQGVKSSDLRLLLWVEPVKPASDIPGWYLQRNPHGIASVNADGSWTGKAQLGNTQWPPHNGDTFNLMVTAVSNNRAQELTARQGTVVLPYQEGESFDTAENLVVVIS